MEYITHVETNKKKLLWTFIRYMRYTASFFCLSIQKKIAKKQKKYTVAVCAIFKNEGVFMKEWLEYHLLIGVEHFYLYNNFSEDNYQEILAPYIKKGVVTLTEWPIQFGQSLAYKDCFQKAKEETQWIAYIDLDEFICPRYELDIRNWIKKYNRYPTVYINWKQFGTSGRLQHDNNQLVIEQYTSCWPLLANSGKSLVNTNYTFQKFEPHLFYPEIKILGIKTTILPVNEFKKFIHYWIMRSPKRKESEIQINHYYNRSYAQYIYKTYQRGDSNSAGSQKAREIPGAFERSETQNTAKDYTIQRFLLLLKLKMQL